MKKRVGILNGTPIVEGDPNLLSNKELLHKGGGSLAKRNIDGKVEDLGGGSGSAELFKYYTFDNVKLETFPTAIELLIHIPIAGVHFIQNGKTDILGDVIIMSSTSSTSITTPAEIIKNSWGGIKLGAVSAAIKIPTTKNIVNANGTIIEISSGDIFSKIVELWKKSGMDEKEMEGGLEIIQRHIIPITEEEYLNFNGE